MIPTIEWNRTNVRMIDQRKLPSAVQWYVCNGYRDVINAIKKMVIRGAPAIGIAAAMGMALGARSVKAKTHSTFMKRFQTIAGEMLCARPTAVNLEWAVKRMTCLASVMTESPVEEIKSALRKESETILSEDIQINRNLGRHGVDLIPEGSTILTHCNAGALATGGYGTALGVIRAAHESGKKIRVIADETRPWFQGLRLTAFEMIQEGIPVSVITDNAAGSLMRRGKIDLVITGADRIAANGDVANKIGTYQVAVLAKVNRVPFYVAAPISTIDSSVKTGDMIPLEERPPEEIYKFGKTEIGPSEIHAINPAFDITPYRYIAGIITEKGILRSPYSRSIKNLLKNKKNNPSITSNA